MFLGTMKNKYTLAMYTVTPWVTNCPVWVSWDMGLSVLKPGQSLISKLGWFVTPKLYTGSSRELAVEKLILIM